MCSGSDLLSDAEWTSHAVEGLERDLNHTLTLDEWSAFLMAQNPKVYRSRPKSDFPTGDRPGTPGKIAVMGLRVAFKTDPFCPDDFHFRDITDEEFVLPVHAEGNFATVGVVPMLQADRKPRPKSLADQCRLWVKEDGELRSRNGWHRPETDTRIRQALARWFACLFPLEPL